jgi:LSD1 subclass zinc finger protein
MSRESLKLICRGCGASLEYSAGMQALKCQYCSTVTEIPNESAEQLAETPDLVVPLSVERNDLIDSVYQHIASGKYTPDNLLEHATFSKVDRFYVPAYVYMGSFEAEWTASFGYDRTEHYTVHERNSQGHSVAVTKTKTVTDWRPVNGSDSGKFLAVGYAGNLLAQSPLAPYGLVESSHGIGDAKPYDTSYVSGLESEAFVVLESDVFSERASPQIDRTIERSVKKHAQGDHQRDWHWTERIEKTITSAFIPVCHVVYEYDGKAYHVWTDGTNTANMVSDTLPVDEARMKTVRAGFVPAGVAAVALPLAGYLGGHGPAGAISGFTLGVVAVAAIYGWWRRHSILEYSKHLRQSLLSQRKAASTNVSSLSESERHALVENVKRPTKSWIADTTRDKIILPVLSFALAATVLSPSLITNLGNRQPDTAVEMAGTRTATPDSAIEKAGTNTLPVANMPEAVPAADIQPPAAQEASPVAAVATPTPATQRSASIGPIVDLLKASASGDWSSVDAQVAGIKSSLPALQQGDRKSARAANAEGLAALNQQQYEPAIAAFARGVAADESDTEVLNNFGYAQLLAGHHNEGVEALGKVLLRVPDRSSGWANLGEGLAQLNNEGASLAALRLAIRFSANRDRTVEYLKRTSENHASPAFRGIASRALAGIDAIPANAAALAQAAKSPAPSQSARLPAPAVRSVAPAPVPAPVPVAAQQTPPPAQPSSPQAFCETKSNFIAKNLCDTRECAKPQYSTSGYCIKVIEIANRNRPGASPER